MFCRRNGSRSDSSGACRVPRLLASITPYFFYFLSEKAILQSKMRDSIGINGKLGHHGQSWLIMLITWNNLINPLGWACRYSNTEDRMKGFSCKRRLHINRQLDKHLITHLELSFKTFKISLLLHSELSTAQSVVWSSSSWLLYIATRLIMVVTSCKNCTRIWPKQATDSIWKDMHS